MSIVFERLGCARSTVRPYWKRTGVRRPGLALKKFAKVYFAHCLSLVVVRRLYSAGQSRRVCLVGLISACKVDSFGGRNAVPCLFLTDDAQ